MVFFVHIKCYKVIHTKQEKGNYRIINKGKKKNGINIVTNFYFKIFKRYIYSLFYFKISVKYRFETYERDDVGLSLDSGPELGGGGGGHGRSKI